MTSEIIVALRVLRRTPATAALAVATLGLGVAVTIGIFSVVRGVMLRGLPYPGASQLALVWQSNAAEPAARGAVSPPDLLDIREQASAFSVVVGVNSFSTTFLPEDGDPEQVRLGVISGDFFEALGVRPLLGRTLELADDRPLNTRDSTAVGLVVLAHGFWASRLGADSSIVGRTIRMGGSRMQVVGVMPESFRLHLPRGAPMSTDHVGWTPLAINYAAAPRDGAYLTVLGRLKPSVTHAQAQAEIEGVAARLRTQLQARDEQGYRLRVVPLEREVVAHIRPVLLVLALSGAVVLLVACANVATLLLVRFIGRLQEVAIRAALGSGRSGIVRPLLIESAIVAFAGTMVGVFLAVPAVRLVLQLEPGIVPRTSALGVGMDMMAPALLLAVLLTVLCGVGPALLVSRGDLSTALRSQRSGGVPGALTARRAIVIAQTAVTFALVYSSTSLVAMLVRLQRADVGFRAEGAMTFVVTLPFALYQTTDSWVAYFEEATKRLREQSGIAAAAAVSDLPMSGASLEPFAPDDERNPSQWGTRSALHQVVTPGYFAAAGVPVRQGRDFSALDRTGGAATAIIDDALARTLAAHAPGSVVGRRLDVTVHEFRPGYRVTRRTVEIVGVVGSVTHDHPDAAPPGTIYLPHAQYPVWAMNLVVRGAGAPPGAAAVRATLRELDARLPLHALQPMTQLAARTFAPTRFMLALIGIFALTVIGLTAAGLFGIMADEVRQRRGELAVRLALGAQPRQISLNVLRNGLVLAAAGILPGLLLSPMAGRTIARGLSGDLAVNPLALAAAAAAVLAVAMAACYIPAWRAGRVDPLSALR